jgi:hypothetical protein
MLAWGAIAQTPISTIVDPKYYDKPQWRHISSARGGRWLGSSGRPGGINEYYFGATGGGNRWRPGVGGRH